MMTKALKMGKKEDEYRMQLL